MLIGCTGDISQHFQGVFRPVSYTHLDVYKRQEENLPVKSFNARSTKDMLSIVNIVLEITSKDQLEKVCQHLKNVKGVEDIERVNS